MTNEQQAHKAGSEFDPGFRPRPYTQDHPDLLAQGLPRPAPRLEPAAFMTGWPRLALVLVALLALAYGLHGLVTDDLYLPRKHAPGTHYHGAGAALVFTVILGLSGCLLALAFGKTGLDRGWSKAQIVAGCLFAGAMAVAVACFFAEAAAG